MSDGFGINGNATFHLGGGDGGMAAFLDHIKH